MSKNSEEIINKVLSEFKKEQQEKYDKFKKEQQEKYDKFKKEQKNKFRKFVVFMVVLCLVISGITGVASYTLAANQVGYTAKDTSWTVDNTQDAIDELRDTVGYALVGSVFSYMGNNAPFGYLACDGTEYNISDYPRLAEHFTSEFGSANYFGGDGETTFAVPDLRGEFLRGTGTNSHTNQGSGLSVGVHQDATEHLNIESDGYYTYSRKISSGSFDQTLKKDSDIPATTTYWQGGNGKGPYTVNNFGLHFTSRPTNTSVLYIIKY